MSLRTISILIERTLTNDKLVAASFHRHLLLDRCREDHLHIDPLSLDRTGKAKIDALTVATIEEVEIIYASTEERESLARTVAEAREARREDSPAREAPLDLPSGSGPTSA
jgi:hypothetical protein